MIKIARPFMQWFDAAGHFVPLPFQQVFASEVPVIGKSDPSKVITGAGGKAVQGVPGEAFQQALDSITVTGGTSGTEAYSASVMPKKGASVKNRKKA
jgi:hypothetical protein